MKSIGFIGLGKMSTVIIAGLDKEAYQIFASGRDFEKTKKEAGELGITALAGPQEVLEKSDIIILAVKPQVLPAVLSSMSPQLSADKIIVSIAAGLTLDELAGLADQAGQPIVRIMPNINASIQASTTAMVANEYVSDEDYQAVKRIFEQVGSVHDIAEKDFANFTAIAGSSPAFIYIFIDALSRAAVLNGLPKSQATQIVAETVSASAQMLMASQENPWALVDKVSSPGGTTVAGVVSLEDTGFVSSVIAAVNATIEKDKALGK
ncbi:pyrroline-5-carboxylate reductase [Lactococcus termiticola]|uniref:Pyrroline-5-carboxylate reductase n=1 Tax=Lactococcus termiticola TaxID=2169526 RepID=A0A2R5HG92_9LACT|nr:pyrroline-5-carboxylate reductase [Lactococcus termiticola]GBG97034.1 pyrroline-5-carboxylate reductase [Lactococcus termiticola]